jgi:hypothetical protein
LEFFFFTNFLFLFAAVVVVVVVAVSVNIDVNCESSTVAGTADEANPNVWVKCTFRGLPRFFGAVDLWKLVEAYQIKKYY